MKNTLIITLIIAIAVSACKYQKVLKGNDYDLKQQTAMELFKKKKYTKAQPLFDQLVPIRKGMVEGEEVEYYRAMCSYKLKDFIMAGYYLRKFASNYPTTKYLEEALFLGAYCYYLDSPKPTLDQENTIAAIQELEIFLTKFPNSSRVDTCNTLLDVLRTKLIDKSYKNAELYYDLDYYKAAGIALNNSLEEYPDSRHREKILFYILKSNYLYANNSIDEKKVERFKTAMNDFRIYKNSFPNGKFLKEAEKINEDISKKLAKLTSK